jgi:cytoskeletal protein CcmA (bactofilin family)
MVGYDFLHRINKNKTSLLKGGVLTGDISTYQLVVDEGADFGGRCKMIDAPVDQKGRETKFEKLPKRKSLLTLNLNKESVEESNASLVAKLRQSIFFFSRFIKIARILLIGFLLVGVFIFINSVQKNDIQKLVMVGYDFLHRINKNKTSLLKGGVLTGDISTYQLVVDEGADFGGRCKMIDAPVDQKGRETKFEKLPKRKSLLTLNLNKESVEESNASLVAKLRQSIFFFSRFIKILGRWMAMYGFVGVFIFIYAYLKIKTPTKPYIAIHRPKILMNLLKKNID